MGSQANKYSLEHLLGNTNIPRLVNPSIRGSVRRLDPDGGHIGPYFSGLTGTSLVVTVTPVGNQTLNFISDDMGDAIAAINAVSPSNLKATDDDGYLRLTNLNPGGVNKLVIVSGLAAPILGYVLSPEPGSASYAGELDTSSAGRSRTSAQNNPQGTALLASDEDFTSSVLNRSIFGALAHIERLGLDLDLEIPVVRSYLTSSFIHGGTGKHCFLIQDSSRFPIDSIESTNPNDFQLDALIRLRTFPTDTAVYDVTQSYPAARIQAAYYSDGVFPTVNSGVRLAVWGTLDGNSIFTTQSIPKQLPFAITSIKGNIIESTGAHFITNTCQVGDTVVISGATNDTPFSHNGEFVIVDVYSETKIGIRAKAAREALYVGTAKPTELNASLPGGSNYGNVSVVIGGYIPATNIMFELPSWVPAATQYYAKVLNGVRLRDLQPADFAAVFENNDSTVLNILYTHITTASSLRHHAADIDAPAVSGSPDALSSGTVGAQLAALLGFVNAGIAGSGAYGGGDPWADGTTNPATTIEHQLDKIIDDLAGAGIDGTPKIRALAAGSLILGTLRDQLNQLDTQWLKLSRNNTVSGQNSFTANQSITGATLFLGIANLVSNAMLAAFITPASGEHQLLWDMGNNLVTNPRLRMYLNHDNQLEFLWNARWLPSPTSNWTSDDNTKSAAKVIIGDSGLSVQYKSPPGASNWADSAFSAGAGNEFSIDLVNTLMTFLGTSDLQKTVTLGSGMATTNTDANTARETLTTVSSKRTLIWKSTTSNAWRFYINDIDFSLEFTRNASFDNATGLWSKDGLSGGANAWRYSLTGLAATPGAIVIDRRDTTVGTWNNSSWTYNTTLSVDSVAILSEKSGNALALTNGDLDVSNAPGAGTGTGSILNPNANASVTNNLRGKNIVKGWAKITGANGGSAPAVVDGFNITSVAKSGSGNKNITVTIAGDQCDSNYVVLVPTTHEVSGVSTIVFFAEAINLTTGTFDITATDVTGVQIDLNAAVTTPPTLHVLWIGAQ